MSEQNLGPSVTYLNPDKKAFKRVVFKEGFPISHAELGLIQDLQNQERTELVRTTLPSGFLKGDFFEDSYSDYQFSLDANQFKLVGKPVLNVAGNLIHLSYTNTDIEGDSVIHLQGPDPSPGSLAADFVYLEIWHALVDPDPSTANKPAPDKLYPYGNVLAHPDTWLDDDLKDSPVAQNHDVETTRRVQVQYAIRSMRLLDNMKIDGYSDVHVEAQGPNSTTLSGIQFSKNLDDTGLWVAGGAVGSGNEIPNTVDGFVYSIPLALVYRRNSAGFDAQSNGNGGIEGVGSLDSDRPDGLFADQIVLNDLKDLRHAVDFGHVDWTRVLDKNVSLLLDNELRSWVTRSSYTGWYVGGSNESFGSRYLKADVIQSKTSPDGPSGNITSHPDGFCRVFSDRSCVQRTVVEYSKVTDWEEDDTLVLDFTQDHPFDALLDIAYEQPTGTCISDVIKVHLNGEDMPFVPVKKITGLGTKTVTIHLDTPSFTSSDDIWVEYEIVYTAGNGLTSLVKEEVTSFNFYLENPSSFNPYFDQVFTDDDTGRDAIKPYIHVQFSDGPHREVTIQYHSDRIRELDTKIWDTNKILLPSLPYLSDTEDPNLDITVEVNGSPATVDIVNGREITLESSHTDGDVVSVHYTELLPLPINGAVFTLYYLAPAMQAIPFEYLQNPEDIEHHSLEIEPLYFPPYLYSGTASSGSVTTPYPYEAPLNQIPVSADVGLVAYAGEEELSASGPISIDDFDGEVGLLRLPVLVPVASIDTIKLKSPVNVVGSNNLEYIDHYTATEEADYLPAVFAQGLSTQVEHKSFYPFLARIKRDTDFARKGSVVLVIMTQYYDYSELMPEKIGVEENRVAFNSPMSCAAVYKVKGNWLSPFEEK
jgi:hypothetical protein